MTDQHPSIQEPHCVTCGKLVAKMTAEEIFNALRIKQSAEWGETRLVLCPACQEKEG